MDAVTDLVPFKESQGFEVESAILEDILATEPGNDDAEKVRNYLINYFPQNPEKDFVLLVGSMDTMPMRIAYVNPDDHGYQSVPTDYYYEELTCEWDVDGDGYYGEWNDDISKANCDYRAEAWVARLPWDDPLEIQAMVDAIIQYETEDSPRMTKAIGTAAVIAIPCDAALYVERAKLDYMTASGYDNTSIYEQCSALSPDFELTRDSFIGQWEALEPGFLAWFSHGSPEASYYGGGTFISVDDIPQNVEPAIAITSGCTVADPESVSLGRVLVREGVVAGFLGSSRVTMPGTNPIPAFNAQYQMGENLIWGRQALSAATANAMEYYVQHENPPGNVPGPDFNQNIFEFMVYGDPAIQAK